MSKYRVFVSNVHDFECAVRAKSDSGPTMMCFSTPSIDAESLNPYDEFERVEKAFPEHEVFKSSEMFVQFYDEHGNEFIPPLLHEDLPDSE